MSKGKKQAKDTFKEAVKNTPDVSNAYCPGLQALGGYSNKVVLQDPGRCEGSVDIDGTTVAIYPQDNRWDYCFSYKGETFFVEVHSADTGEVSTVIRKLQWLKDWLHNKAPRINAIKATSRHPFYWVQSNGFHILPNSAQYRRAIQNNIKPVARLALP
ncbi:hypothetical protein DC498_01600 [Terrimonas sp.]|uniref:hypothetical protein n=1 Tax=Terrimonas sp. TaxID=1914338 RepID=UPI000D513C85|nr:hypothetical protein [Terrimonas sp.]PVD54111.1 hypothetical protein DC498_01600 [Terrimonas sp.]